jgi:hypothetical protein
MSNCTRTALETAHYELTILKTSEVDAAMTVIKRVDQDGGIHAIAKAAAEVRELQKCKKWKVRYLERRISTKRGELSALSGSFADKVDEYDAIRGLLKNCSNMCKFWVDLFSALHRLSVPINREDIAALKESRERNAGKTQGNRYETSQQKAFKAKRITTTDVNFSESQKLLDPKKIRTAGFIDEPNGEPWGTTLQTLHGQESTELQQRVQLCKDLKIGSEEFMTNRYSLAYLNCLELLQTGGCHKIIEIFKPAMTVFEAEKFEQEFMRHKTLSLGVQVALVKHLDEVTSTLRSRKKNHNIKMGTGIEAFK